MAAAAIPSTSQWLSPFTATSHAVWGAYTAMLFAAAVRTTREAVASAGNFLIAEKGVGW